MSTSISTCTRRAERALGCAGVALVVMLSACGGSGSDSSKAPEHGDEEFGLTFKELVARVEAVEQRIAECMADAGFEYVANDFDTVRRAMKASQSAPGLSESEFRAEFGFGISTQSNKPIVSLGLGEHNSRIREGLTPDDQVAYDHTLLGEHRDAIFANALEEEDLSRTGGCTREAVQQEFTEKELSTAYINPGDQLVDQDPRVIEAFAKYADCMKDAGLDYPDPSVVEDDIRERFDAITGGEDPATLEGRAAQELAELQDLERRVAEVANRCENKFVDPVTEAVDQEIYGRRTE
jgi:hypothetical protein